MIVKRIKVNGKIVSRFEKKRVQLKHILNPARAYDARERERMMRQQKPPTLELFEFKGEGKEWNGFDLFKEKEECEPQSIAYFGLFKPDAWYDATGFPGIKCRIDGQIAGLSGKRMMGWKAADGYISVTVWDGAKQRKVLAHRIIASTFIPNPLRFPIVNHINGIKDDNRACNLEWCTSQHNVRHGFKLRKGLNKNSIGKHPTISPIPHGNSVYTTV